MQNPASIRVSPDDQLAWDAALKRFQEHDLWVQPVNTADSQWQVYCVESYRARTDATREPHMVTVDLSGPDTYVGCDCEAAQLARRPCCHAAAALREAGALPVTVARSYVCARCGYRTTDPDLATRHWLLTCPALGGNPLLGTAAARELARP